MSHNQYNWAITKVIFISKGFVPILNAIIIAHHAVVCDALSLTHCNWSKNAVANMQPVVLLLRTLRTNCSKITSTNIYDANKLDLVLKRCKKQNRWQDGYKTQSISKVNGRKQENSAQAWHEWRVHSRAAIRMQSATPTYCPNDSRQLFKKKMTRPLSANERWSDFQLPSRYSESDQHNSFLIIN